MKLHFFLILGHCARPKFKCDSCDFESTNKAKLSQHILLVHGVKPFECETCDRKFTRKEHLKAHLESKCRNYKIIQNSFSCASCDRIFTNEAGLKNHMDLTCKNAKINVENQVTAGQKIKKSVQAKNS